jgi:hypothetical protein
LNIQPNPTPKILKKLDVQSTLNVKNLKKSGFLDFSGIIGTKRIQLNPTIQQKFKNFFGFLTLNVDFRSWIWLDGQLPIQSKSSKKLTSKYCSLIKNLRLIFLKIKLLVNSQQLQAN